MILRVSISGLVVALTVLILPSSAWAADDHHVEKSSHPVAEDPHDAGKHAEEAKGNEDTGGSHNGHSNTNPLSINPDLAVVTALIFLILMLVLYKFAWGPIVAGLEKREQGIADNIQQARRSAEQAEERMAQYEAKLAEAANEVRAMLEEARRDADFTRQRIVNEAQEAAAEEKQRAVREIDLAKKQALQELWQESVDRAFDLASQVVGRELDTEDHSRLVKESLNKLSQN